jgi:hypothetical protein
MKKTRKIRNKKLFLKWLKKSHKNKYSIVHIGGTGNGNGNEVDTNPPAINGAPVVDINSQTEEDYIKQKENEYNSVAQSEKSLSEPKKKGFLSFPSFLKKKKDDGYDRYLLDESTKARNITVGLAASDSLIDLASSMASNPTVLSAISGVFVVGTTAFTSVVGAGVPIAAILIITYIRFKIKAAFGNYYKLVHSMNNLMLLVKRIYNILLVAIVISSKYNFIFDTKDITNSLEIIVKKFDKLLSKETKEDIIGEITSDLKKPKESIEKKIDAATLDAEKNVNETNDNESQSNTNTNSGEIESKTTAKSDDKEVKTKAKTSKINSIKRYLNIAVFFNADDFSKELNEEITKLALYFSIFLGEFNILLNVSQISELTQEDKEQNVINADVRLKNDVIKRNNNFKEVLMSTLLYRILQIHNMFELCKRDRFRDTLCSGKANEGYVKEVDSELSKIKSILKHLDDKGNANAKFPLYVGTMFRDLKDITKGIPKFVYEGKVTPTNKDRAQEFCQKIYDFNKSLSSQNS